MFLARVVGWVLRVLSMTWRVDRMGPITATSPSGPVVYAFLHGGLVALAPTHRDRDVSALVSRSRDGEIASAALRSMGMSSIRGSSTRGGMSAAREALRCLATGSSLAIAVDGPRGPAGYVSPGAVRLSRRAGVPIIWVRPEIAAGFRLGTWDGQAIPLPFARVRLFYGAIDSLAPEATDQLEASLSLSSCFSRGLFRRALSTGVSSPPPPPPSRE